MAYQHELQMYDDLHETEVEVIEEFTNQTTGLVHWSKANARQKMIIEAKLALGVEPDGVLCWYVCHYCDPDSVDGWSLQLRYPAFDACPQCGAATKPNVYDMWCVEES